MSTALCFEYQEESNTHALKSFMHDMLIICWKTFVFRLISQTVYFKFEPKNKRHYPFFVWAKYKYYKGTDMSIFAQICI